MLLTLSPARASFRSTPYQYIDKKFTLYQKYTWKNRFSNNKNINHNISENKDSEINQTFKEEISEEKKIETLDLKDKSNVS